MKLLTARRASKLGLAGTDDLAARRSRANSVTVSPVTPESLPTAILGLKRVSLAMGTQVDEPHNNAINDQQLFPVALQGVTQGIVRS